MFNIIHVCIQRKMEYEQITLNLTQDIKINISEK